MHECHIDCLGRGLCSPSAVLVDVLIVQAIEDRYERARKLCEILETRDDDLLPVFCQTLIDTGQPQVAHLLGFPGSSVACSINSTLVLFSDQQNLCYYFLYVPQLCVLL